MKSVVKLAAIATALTLITHQASAQTLINALPYVISAPGDYLLTQNLTVPAQATQGAITVNANNVTIDLNGFYIAKTEGAASISFGIYANNRTNITVKNGIIVGFLEGIRFDYTGGTNINSNHLVDGVRFTNEQSVGIFLLQATNCLIQNCAFANTGYDYLGNIVTGSGIGILVDGSPAAGNALINNRIAPLQEGIYTRNGQNFGGTYLEGNIVSKCAIGFYLAQDDKYRNNTTISCQTPFNASGTNLGGNN